METEDLEKNPVSCVHIRMEIVLKVRKLHRNFRGMRKAFEDGLEIKIAWDMQAWLFREAKSDAKGKKNHQNMRRSLS
ncbi:hypothetical protein NL676_004746 [Syzygium grande]|nr:hypothetical protein NL676_004746 [Syzygium grande]